jgi:P27 family predicted phage terminase small subunit
MGRRPDPPGAQAAKGNPGRRISAVRRRELEAERIAELLAASAPDPADPNAPPALIDRGPLCAAAIAVWRELAPRLASTHRLQPQHRPLFATFCVYFAEWVGASDDVMRNGPIQSVNTIAGGKMERTRPIVQIRDRAFEMVLKLSDRFGLTPSDEYAIFKDQALAAQHSPGLFDAGQPRQPREGEGEAGASPVPGAGSGVTGRMKAFDSEPPAGRC